MNKQEKQVEQAQLNKEKQVLKDLKAMYQEALDGINEKIKLLQTDPLIQSKAYQIEYQKVLKSQIETYLDALHDKEYDTIEEFLKESYNNGFIGTMYSIHAQGIPLILPIAQEQVVRAIQLNSKISEGLYTRLGIDIKDLKKNIRAEVTRGITAGLGYNDIARNINNVSNVGMNKAMRIARTESHSIKGEASNDAAVASKEQGADIVRQWDASLDGSTRPSHRQVDGEIRELDEKFSNGLRYAGDRSGSAAEVINCRCATLTRARWALDEEELDTLKERAEYYGLDKSKEFEDYKKKYLQASEQEAVSVHKSSEGTSQEKVKIKAVNKEGKEIKYTLEGMANENQEYVKEKIAWLSSEYDTLLLEVQYDRSLMKEKVDGRVDISSRVMSLRTAKVVEHEFFHTLNTTKLIKYGMPDRNEDFWKEAKSLFRDYKKKAINNSKLRISGYSLENVDEFMAEAFAVAKGGKISLIAAGNESPYVEKALSIIDKYFKKATVTDDVVKETLEKVGKSSKIDLKEVIPDTTNYKYATEKEYSALAKQHAKNIAKADKQQIEKHAKADGSSGGYVATHNYSKINSNMRNDNFTINKLDDDDIKTIESLRNAIAQNTLDDDYVLTRYVNGDYITSVFGIKTKTYSKGDLEPICNMLTQLANPYVVNEGIPLITEELRSKIGETITEKAFLSTSLVKSKNIMQDKAVLFEIHAPKGTHAYIPKNRKESECILADNTKLIIENVEYSSIARKWIITVKVQ